MSFYVTVMTLALAPGLFLHVLPSGFVPMVKSVFPVNPCDDGTDVFAEESSTKEHECTSSGLSSFPLPMLFDLISNPSSDLSTESEATLLERPILPQVTRHEGAVEDTSEQQSQEDFPDNFIRRAISSAISFGSRASSTNGNSPKNGDQSPGGNSDGSGRSSNGIKIVSSHYESSTPSESDDNLIDEGYEIVTDMEINQLNP